MSSSSWVRWAVSGALMAVIGLTVSSIVAFALVQPPASNMGPVGSLSWYLIESSDAIAEVGILAALVGLHVRQSSSYGRLGTAGFIAAFVGTACFVLSTVIWLLTKTDGMFLGILFSSALLGWLVGFPLLGIATLRARVLPRWGGLLLVAYPAVFLLAFFLVDFYGEARVLLGLPWLALGYALWSERGASVIQPRVGAKT